MQRTNLYLEERQVSVLDQRARQAGVSRAELVRRLIDRAVGSGADDADADIAAINESFGVLNPHDGSGDWADGLRRSGDMRAEHLKRVRRL